MLPSYRAFARTLYPPRAVSAGGGVRIPVDRLITDPLRLLTRARRELRSCPDRRRGRKRERSRAAARRPRLGTPVVPRRRDELSGRRSPIRAGCSETIGAAARSVRQRRRLRAARRDRCDPNRRLAGRRKIGPDPASIDAAMIGGIAASSGGMCWNAQNSYHTLEDCGCAGQRHRAAARSCEPRRVPRARIRAHPGAGRNGARDARRRSAGGAHPPQVPLEEHNRLQSQCAGRLRGPGRGARAPDDRLRGNARIPERDHLCDRPGLCQQGKRADPLRRSRNRMPGSALLKQTPVPPSSSPTARRCARWKASPDCPRASMRSGRAARPCWSSPVPRIRGHCPNRYA